MIAAIITSDSVRSMSFASRYPWAVLPNLMQLHLGTLSAQLDGQILGSKRFDSPNIVIGRNGYDALQLELHRNLLPTVEKIHVISTTTDHVSSKDAIVADIETMLARSAAEEKDTVFVGGSKLIMKALPHVDLFIWNVFHGSFPRDSYWPHSPFGGMWDQGFEITERRLVTNFFGTAVFRRREVS